MAYVVRFISGKVMAAAREPERIEADHYSLEGDWYNFYSYRGSELIQISSIRAVTIERIDAV